MTTTLEDAFGQDWSNQHEASKKSDSSGVRVNIEGGLRQSVIKAIKEKMKPGQPQMMYPTENDYFHIMLVQAWETFEPRPLKFGVGINFKWGRKWLSAAMSEELSRAIQPNEYYILVGKLTVKQGTKPGVEFNNFSTYGIISMSEIAEYKGGEDAGTEDTTADSE